MKSIDKYDPTCQSIQFYLKVIMITSDACVTDLIMCSDTQAIASSLKLSCSLYMSKYN